MWITQLITPQGSIMEKTQEVNGAVAPFPKFLDDNREGNQLSQRTSIHTHSLGATFTTSKNLLQQAFSTQSHIGWDNFLKGRISRDWLT
jgi:hypothetical protein